MARKKKKKQKRSKKRGERPHKRALKDVELAEQLIAYGKRKQLSEAFEMAALVLQEAAWDLESDDSDAREPFVLAEEELAAADLSGEPIAAGPVTRGAPTSGQVSSNQWTAVIDKGKSYTLQPSPLFAKKSEAVVNVTADEKAKMFVYWRRVDRVPENDDVKSGRKSVTAKWKTGLDSARWEIRIQNRSGPDGLQVAIKTNSVG